MDFKKYSGRDIGTALGSSSLFSSISLSVALLSILGDDTSGLCSFGKTQEVPGGDDRWSLTGSQQHDDRLGAAMAGHAGAQRSEQKNLGGSSLHPSLLNTVATLGRRQVAGDVSSISREIERELRREAS